VILIVTKPIVLSKAKLFLVLSASLDFLGMKRPQDAHLAMLLLLTETSALNVTILLALPVNLAISYRIPQVASLVR